nr:putative capsid [Marmot picobirnavirus]
MSNRSRNTNSGKSKQNAKSITVKEITVQGTNPDTNQVTPKSAKQPYKGKGGNKNNRGNSKCPKETRNDGPTKGMNDISWYSHNPQMLKSSSTIPFASIVGGPIPFSGDTPRVPGILSFGWEPEFGGELNGPAFNQAADSEFSYLVHANSRSYSYDAPDLMIAIVAGANVFSLISSMERAYGLKQFYQEQSRYTPDTLLAAMGFNPSDFQDHLSDIWFDLNRMINETRQIWLPNSMPLFKRWWWLNANVYRDSDLSRSQMFVFTQAKYYYYNATGYETGGLLTTVNIDPDTQLATGGSGTTFDPSAHTYTWNQWKSVFRLMMDKLISQQDRGIMYGDILNAYGLDKIYGLTEIPSSYTIAPIFSAEVLTQIENLTINKAVNNGLWQKQGKLYTIPGNVPLTGKATLNQINQKESILNYHGNPDPTPEDNMIATRLTALGCVYTGDEYIIIDKEAGITDFGDVKFKLVKPEEANMIHPATVGSDSIISAYMWSTPWNRSNPAHGVSIDSLFRTTSALSQNYGPLMAFDWHPFCYVMKVVAGNVAFDPIEDDYNYGALSDAFGNYDNYTVITYKETLKMHDAALFSLLGIPQI